MPHNYMECTNGKANGKGRLISPLPKIEAMWRKTTTKVLS